MSYVLHGLVHEHDLPLLALALALCAFSVFIGFDLLARSRREHGKSQLLWFLASAFVLAMGIWSTHFVAMLDYEPGVATGLTAAPIIVSAVAGLSVISLSLYWLATQPKLGIQRSMVAGIGIFIGVAALHCIGMAGLAVEGRIEWHIATMGASVVSGATLGTAGIVLFGQWPGLIGRTAAASLVTAGVATLHLMGMSALTIIADPAVALPSSIVSREWLVAGATGSMTMVTVLGLCGFLFDYGLTRRALVEARRFATLANSAFEGIAVFEGGRLVHANGVLTDMLGAQNRDLSGMSPEALFGREAMSAIAPILSDGGRSAEVAIRQSGGRKLPVELLARKFDDSNTPQVVLALRDLSERKSHDERMQYMARHDALTGLFNRAHLTAMLEAAIEEARGRGTEVALHFIDLDHFKEVNDRHGHEVGDRVLVKAAERLRAVTGPDDIVARIGGDEMIVVQSGVGREAAAASAQSIVEAFRRPMVGLGAEMCIGASVGYAVFPTDSADRSGLMRNADLALYQAKSEGKGVWRAFNISMASKPQERWLLAQELRKAIDEEMLTVMYQPQTRVSDSKVVGYEALVRWTHPERGPVPPSEFIPIAEEAGLICGLGELVLRRACADAVLWRDDLTVSVNISSLQIFQCDLIGTLRRILDASGLAPHRLELEITETALMSDIERACEVLERVKGLGVKIALDDFGTGFSSLSHLQSIAFDRIKIDRSFVRDMEFNRQSQVIVRTVCALAQGLGVSVVAEGVETAEQLRMLAHEKCDTVQGFYLGYPQRLETFAATVAKESCKAA
jgi:diguanylate cyclase (GGDEF)-like protein/PAS domain S-box-containing protein